MARNKRTGVQQPSVYEAKLHAKAERLQSEIAGWTRVRVLVACSEKPYRPLSHHPALRLSGTWLKS